MNTAASLDRARPLDRAATATASPPRKPAASARPAARQPQPDIQHLLDGLAGFYDCEADALAAVHQLGVGQGLKASQLALMGPADASRLRFTWLARQWNRRPNGARGMRPGLLGAVGLIGAVLSLLAALGLLEFDGLLSAELQLFTVVGATLCGAAAAAGLVALLHSQQPQYIDFDRRVRHKLAAGAWAVVVHDLLWAQQPTAVALIRRQGGQWCAVSSARRLM